MTCCTVVRRLVFIHNVTLSFGEHSVAIYSKREADGRSAVCSKARLKGEAPEKVCNSGVAKAVNCTRITIWQEVELEVMRERPNWAHWIVTFGSLFGKRRVLMVYSPFSEITYLLGLLRSGGSIAKQRLLDPSRAWTKPCLHTISQTLHR